MSASNTTATAKVRGAANTHANTNTTTTITIKVRGATPRVDALPKGGGRQRRPAAQHLARDHAGLRSHLNYNVLTRSGTTH